MVTGESHYQSLISFVKFMSVAKESVIYRVEDKCNEDAANILYIQCTLEY